MQEASAYCPPFGGCFENDMHTGGVAPARLRIALGTANTPAPTSRPEPVMVAYASAPSGLRRSQASTANEPSQKLMALLAPGGEVMAAQRVLRMHGKKFLMELTQDFQLVEIS